MRRLGVGATERKIHSPAWVTAHMRPRIHPQIKKHSAVDPTDSDVFMCGGGREVCISSWGT
eukprot:4024271-Pyramimonas_sp.AAC.1